jgi:hypothetical protein
MSIVFYVDLGDVGKGRVHLFMFWEVVELYDEFDHQLIL